MAAALAIGLVVVLLETMGGEATRPSFQPGIVIVDSQTGKQLVSIPTSMVNEPDDVVYTGACLEGVPDT